MKIPTSPPLLLAGLLALAIFAAAPPAFAVAAAGGDKILDAVLRAPGDYDQVCDIMTRPMPLALPVWRPDLSSGAHSLSGKKKKLLQEKRAVVLPSLQKRLESVSFSREPQEQSPDKKPDSTFMEGGFSAGVDPQSFSDVLLDVALEIKAVEALPQLLNLEAKLHDALARAEKDPKAPIPQMDGFSGIRPQATAAEEKDQRDYDQIPAAEKAMKQRRVQICGVQAGHRTLLTLIGNLLREAKYQPLLDSKLEKTYQAKLREAIAGDKVLKGIKTAADIPKDERSNIRIDPVTGLPTSGRTKVDIPYSEELRASIRRMAADYLAGHRG